MRFCYCFTVVWSFFSNATKDQGTKKRENINDLENLLIKCKLPLKYAPLFFACVTLHNFSRKKYGTYKPIMNLVISTLMFMVREKWINYIANLRNGLRHNSWNYIIRHRITKIFLFNGDNRVIIKFRLGNDLCLDKFLPFEINIIDNYNLIAVRLIRKQVFQSFVICHNI